MPKVTQVNNGDSGLTARTAYNNALASVDLASAEVTGVLPTANGGAGTAGTNFAVGSLGLAGGQTIAGGTLTTQNLTLRANAADTTTGAVAITTSTASTSSTTGALTVAGGVGIAGATYVGGVLVAAGQTSLGGLAGSECFRAVPVASMVNRIEATGAATAATPYLFATGSDTNVNFNYFTKGTGAHQFLTNAGTTQLAVTHTASANRHVTITGSNGGNPTIGTSSGFLNIAPTLIASGDVGIGQAVPASRLHIRQDLDGTARQIIQNRFSGGAPVTEISFITGTVDLSDNRYAYIRSSGSSSSIFEFGTSNAATPTTKLTIGATGQISMGGPVGAESLRVNNVSSAVNRVVIAGAVTAGTPAISVDGTDTNIGLNITTKNTGVINLMTNSGVAQMQIIHTASANRYVTVTGSNGGDPIIATSAGNLSIAPSGGVVSVTGIALASGAVIANNGTAIPAGGTTGAGFRFSSTSNYGVFFGSGAPTLSAAQGSLYLRSDGSSTTTRAYINTNGSTTWTALTTVA